MRFACCVSKATRVQEHGYIRSPTFTPTQREICNIYRFFTTKMISERFSTLRSTYIACFVELSKFNVCFAMTLLKDSQKPKTRHGKKENVEGTIMCNCLNTKIKKV